MTRFSVSGDEEDREGPSLPPYKRRRSYSFSSESEDDYFPRPVERFAGDYDDHAFTPSEPPLQEMDPEEDEDDEGVEEEEEEEAAYEEGYVSEFDSSLMGPAPTYGSVATNRTEKSIPVVLTDPDVLDCCICFEPLTIPVFQCENGHIACSSCCTKINHKCPSCSWPIGYNRCRAIEKVLESVKIACQNANYGCKETVTFSKKKDHEKICTYSACSCPLRTCDFVSSSKQLYLHFRSVHMHSALDFEYNSNFSVTLKDSDDFLVLQERYDDVLFILNSNNETFGNTVWVSCIWPCTYKGFFYDLLAKTDENTLRLQSFTNCTPDRVDIRPSTGFLLIPKDLFGSCGELKLDLSIRLDD
ncbi:E3 ubiquitin-protein ligase SIN-like [Trema orientale]|uniref:RING-type E3 ubiquitin transferase n=1 Tax=Trema orientale TaxID=63057 RepID=A0A2P5CBV4_TREOI|nr:E3 ubiquitin-protein ligase SIN-like [Trema orientale]